MTGIAAGQPEVAGVVNYAAALAFELRKDTVSQRYSLSLLFKNGTDDADFRTMTMAAGQTSVWLDDFEQTYSVRQLVLYLFHVASNSLTRLFHNSPTLSQA